MELIAAGVRARAEVMATGSDGPVARPMHKLVTATDLAQACLDTLLQQLSPAHSSTSAYSLPYLLNQFHL